MEPRLHALTVDVEEYFQVEGLAGLDQGVDEVGLTAGREFLADEFHSRRTAAGTAHADLFLDELDQLDEFWHGVEP